MRCLGLDVASETGWAHGDLTGRPLFGTFKLPALGKSVDVDVDARAMGGLYGSILALVRENQIEVTALESPLPNIKRANSRGILTDSSHRSRDVLLMMFGVALAAVRNGGCKTIYRIEPATWRKAVLGNGYPQHPKEMAIDYCRLVFKCDMRNHNAAEAVCLWAWALGQSKLL